MEGTPLASFQAETWTESRGASGLSWAWPIPQTLKVHVGLGGPFRTLVCGPAMQQV